MNEQRILRIAVAAVVVALLPALALASEPIRQEEQQRPPIETRLYRLQHMSLESAYTLARSACMETTSYRGPIRCDVEVMQEEGTLIVNAISEIHDRVAALLADVDRPPHTQAFHIVVVAANHEGPGTSELPEGAMRALEDIKAFLPYEGFRVLDTGWLKTARYGETSLTGPTGFRAELHFRGDPTSGESMVVEFRLAAKQPAVMIPAGLQGEPQAAYWRNILESTFSMSLGETVVVGTSKLDPADEGASALVILLTALDEGGEGARRR